ncbi:hypothetical protein MST22_04965 [Virgibacillus halodenitrificans]|uniref:hypothetical protein n=1 Tax=Virgibacillus halodenitrificans TaxID=1482 RepID=UPI001FB44D87|nr:hypothetical protein [Virgibacillus halodenitrificans]MCJ0930499.1 hypothetical protein [Virgibacillus halodenitrificans]
MTENLIIMLTANNFEKNRKGCVGLGVNNYVTKPFYTRELEALVKANLKNN